MPFGKSCSGDSVWVKLDCWFSAVPTDLVDSSRGRTICGCGGYLSTGFTHLVLGGLCALSTYRQGCRLGNVVLWLSTIWQGCHLGNAARLGYRGKTGFVMH